MVYIQEYMSNCCGADVSACIYAVDLPHTSYYRCYNCKKECKAIPIKNDTLNLNMEFLDNRIREIIKEEVEYGALKNRYKGNK